MNIAVLLAIQLVFLLCYSELQESYGDKMKNCLKYDDNHNCICCKSGYRGSTCNNYCKQCSSRIFFGNCSYSCRNGHYGETCNKTCPTTCANGVSGVHLCTETNGTIECDYGCIQGYAGKQCSNCTDSHYYGEHCNITCNKGCKSETCNRTGHCTLGCVDGFHGGRCYHCGSNCIERKCTQNINSTYVCTKGCVDGYMGSNCSKMCPVQCATCEQRSGSCMSCVGNYVYMPETGECENQPDNPILIIMGLVISLVILGVISVIVIVRLKKKCDGNETVYSMVRINDMDIEWNSNLKIEWTEKEEKRLRADILQDRKNSKGEKIKINLLVFGQSGHGKSTLCNGFRSALSEDGRVCHYFPTGMAGADSTFTNRRESSLHGLSLRIMDMSGLFETDNLTDDNIAKLLRGEQLGEHTEVYNRVAKEPDAVINISCLVIVLRPDREFGPNVQRILNVAADLVKEGVLCRRPVITFLDKIDSIFARPKNIPQFLKSTRVKKTVMEMSEMTGIPPSAISVVSNYWNQAETDLHTNILLLHVLDDILFDAQEHHEYWIANHRPTDKCNRRSDLEALPLLDTTLATGSSHMSISSKLECESND